MNIAIWGMGVSGLGALKYLKTKTNHTVYAINEGVPNTWKDFDKVKTYLSDKQCFNQASCRELASEIDLIVLSPGIDPNIEALSNFKNIKKICEVELAFREIKIPVIAVTGTNGKTSTVTMLKEAFKLAGKSPFVGGNIGVPFCDILTSANSYDIAIIELSSFQLELLDTFRPNVAVVLNITKSHMERYKNFEEYRDAKLNIGINQEKEDLLITENAWSKVLRTEAQIEIISPVLGYNFQTSKLVGDHHRSNFDVVEKVLDFYNISDGHEIVQDLISNFKGVKYRLEFMRTIGKVDFYNDSKSTNMASTISAVKSFSDKRVLLILGGKLRDDSRDVFDDLKNQKHIREIIAFGEARDLIDEVLGKNFSIKKADKLSAVFSLCEYDVFDIIVFSPGFPSFDQYTNYIERGNEFQEIVLSLS